MDAPVLRIGNSFLSSSTSAPMMHGIVPGGDRFSALPISAASPEHRPKNLNIHSPGHMLDTLV